jgi:hypothetical protein
MSSEIFESSDYYTGRQLDEAMVRRAEEDLGLRLPRSYVEVLFTRNGGTLRRRCFPTNFPTSWAGDHFEVKGLRGIGGKWSIDSTGGKGSAYLIREWEYPDIGVVICTTPSGGHDTVMLDYSRSGPEGEPAVAYVDEDRVPRRISGNFEGFLFGLLTCDHFAVDRG